MPYQRHVQFETQALAWQDVMLVEAVPAWSASYLASGPRLLLPGPGAMGCELNGRRFVCDSFNGVWLTPAQGYRLRQPQARQRSTVLVVHDDKLSDLRPGRKPLALSVHLQLSLWRSALRQGQAPRLALEEALFGLLHGALGNVADPAAGTALHRAVERAREYLAAQPQISDSLAEIAAVACCSPFHLARAFRRQTGKSLHGYRTQLRMVLALQRIEHGQDDLAALAGDLGYSSHSHFTATFARHFGCTPRQLRTNLTARKRR